MKTLRASLTVLLLVAAFYTAAAQEQPRVETKKQEDILRLLRLTGSAELGLQFMDQMFVAFEDAFPDVPAELWMDIRNEIKAEDLLTMAIPIYDKYYTHEDIKQLIAFYESPIGKKMVEVTPLLMQESMEAGQEWGRGLSEKILKKLEDEGYSKM